MIKKRWADFSRSERAGIVGLAVLQVGLLAASLWDLAHRAADEVRGDRRIWAGLVFINWIGPLAYFTVGRKRGIGGLTHRASRAGEDEPAPSVE